MMKRIPPLALALLAMFSVQATFAETPARQAIVVRPIADTSPARALAATIVYDYPAPHQFVVYHATPGMKLATDLHTVGTGILTGFDFRYANRAAVPSDLSVYLYSGSPTDDPPGTLLAGPYTLSALPPDPAPNTHDVHVEIVGGPYIPTSHLWVAFSETVFRCGVSMHDPGFAPTTGTTHFALWTEPAPSTTQLAARFTLYLDNPVGVGPAPAAALEFSPPSPNPLRDGCSFDFALPAAGDVRLVVYDATGRRVRGLIDGPRDAGPNSIRWDARNEAGARVSPGAYWARLRCAAGERVRRVVVF